MTKKDEMRRQAEEKARANGAKPSQALSPVESEKVLHELQVHQIELEIQNEELRRAQQELATAQARYFELYDLAPVGYCTVSEHGLVLEANLTAGTMLGLGRGALVNQMFSRFILSEDQDIFYQHRKQLLETGRPQDCELRMVKNGGTAFWAHITAVAAEDDLGDTIFRLALSDISEHKRDEEGLQQNVFDLKYANSRTDDALASSERSRLALLSVLEDEKKAEQELRNSEEKWRMLVSTSPDFITLHDLEGGYLYLNHYAEGFSESDVIGKSLYDFIAEGSREKYQKAFKACIETKATQYLDYTAYGDNATIRTYETYLVPVMIKDQIQSIMAIAKDITERKQGEQELRESEERFKALHNSSFGGIAIHDKGLILECNQGLSGITGYSREELIGMNGLLLIKEDYRDLVMNNILAGYEKPYEAAGVRKNGETYPLRLEARNIPYKGKSVRTVEFRDISEQKKAEQQILLNQKRLESLVTILQADSDNVQQFLDFALEEAIHLTGSKIGYIYYYSEEKKEFTLNTWSKEVMPQCTVANPQSIYQLEKTGIWGEAVRQRKPVMVNDFKATNPLKKGLPQGHAPLQNFLTVPVFAGGQIVAVVGMANKETDYDQYDVLQLTILMDSVWKVIDRKKAGDELKEREARLQKIFEILPVGLWFADKNGKLIQGNPAGVNIWGAEPHVPIEEYGVFKARHLPEGREIAPDDWALAHTIKEGTTVAGELLEIDAFDGKKKIILNYTAPVLDDKGQIQGAIVVNNDITELKKSETLQRALYQISDAAIGCRDLQQLYLQIHRTISGLMPAENLYIALYDQKANTISFPYYRDQKNDYNAPRQFGKGLTEHIIATQKPLLVNQQVHDQLQRDGQAEFVGQPSQQWLGAPLQSENKTFGTLVVQSYDEKSEYTQRDLELLSFVAGHVAVAIRSIQAGQELAESESRYKTFMDSATDIAFLKDDQSRYLMVNQAQQEFFGLPAGQILGKTDDDLMPKEAAQACRLSDQMVLESKQTMLSHEQVGNRIYEVRKFPVDLQNGKTGVGAYIRDITEQQRADQAIRESQEKYRDLVENINDVVFAVDIYGKLIYISPSSEPVLGYRPDEIIGRKLIEFVKEDDRTLLARELQKSLEKGVAASEYRITNKNGSTKWISSSSRLILEDGKPVGLNGLMTDITERKQAEEQIRQAAKKWETTFDSIGDGVCLLDRQWKILQCNQAFYKMVKKPFDQVLGRTCYELVHGLKKPQEHCPVVRMEKSLHRETLELERDDRFLLVTADPIFDQQKNLIGAVHIISDITDRKLMEQELLQAQKMEAVGFLAGGVAHDFNNMLAGIVGNAELLQLKIYGQKELEAYVDNIIKASGHAASLTKQLLAFARKGQYQQVPVNVHKVIAEAMGILGNTIDRRIKIEQHLRANPAVVLGDHSQLENAFMNLGINARDAMPEGGKLIFSTDLQSMDEEYISQHNYKIKPGQYIQITVEDTGSGMSEAVKRHLFEPFFTTKEKGRGTGLGLAGIYGCVKNHGGSIEVYSELGRGTAIKIYLPLYAGLTAGEADSVQLKETAVTAGTGSILIVDDEDMIRTIAAQILKTAGYQVQTCADGQEAVELYARDHSNIDLVIMDMVMPKVDGRQAYAKMREINPGVKMLLSSGFSEDGAAQSLLQEGALGFIQKPYRSAELLLRVQQAMQATPNQSLRGNPPA